MDNALNEENLQNICDKLSDAEVSINKSRVLPIHNL